MRKQENSTQTRAIKLANPLYIMPLMTSLSNHPIYLDYLNALRVAGFTGDISSAYANRVALATDNSIYQVLPQAVVCPRTTDDLVKIVQLSQQPQFKKIIFSARGGGTGTNGQFLTSGIVVDTAKYMNRILEINSEERWARVQCGVVKDQLNAAVAEAGLFFAPELSTSNRATIGGMISTDASGQGSCRHGKTRDHVIELTSVLLDGSVWTSHAINQTQLEDIQQRNDRIGEIHQLIDSIDTEYHTLIAEKFPKLNRCLTGYDLAHIRDQNNHFNLNNILCGSEGTLGFIVEAKINLLPIPKHSALVNVNYRDFNAALRDATELMRANPASIETIDSTVLNLAKKDNIWHSIAEFFSEAKEAEGINLVEYTADTVEELQQEIEKLTTLFDAPSSDKQARMNYSIAWGNEAVEKIWKMRKKAVGLLGNMQGERRPVPFVEDTAVPPEHLADFILEFRAILDSYNLTYGMFGHVDAGVLHVRPALDMKDPEQEKMVRIISNKVVALTKKYKGLLWGEHGKGFRSEYSPDFFGELYPQLQRIKVAFDPFDQLNPGKIATPSAMISLFKIDEITTRGQENRKISLSLWNDYQEAVHCNGNGLCHSWDPKDTMCPSWKATHDHRHSPKGRASLLREWLKLTGEEKNRFSHEVYDSMMGCLACKSCVGQCPIKVDVPAFRATFLSEYYKQNARPIKDYLVGSLEFFVPWLAKWPQLYNWTLKFSVTRTFMERVIGLVDNPSLSNTNFNQALKKLSIDYATQESIAKLTGDEKQKTVILVLDAFTRYFETPLVIDALTLLQKCGYTPLVAPYKPNGKPLQVHGFLKAFAKTASTNAQHLSQLAESGISLVGLEPAMTLVYRDEYKKMLGDKAPQVLLIQEWLNQPQNHSLIKNNIDNSFSEKHSLKQEYYLLAHCTEKTNAPQAIKDWQNVFALMGKKLLIADAGCCGMAGTYGHELANLETSKKIYALSWAEQVNDKEKQGKLLATGYSCRCQTQRVNNINLQHPLQILLQQT
jgi:FAD/FMN-containing dehydrogenase/Fe-S oxidoreductase